MKKYAPAVLGALTMDSWVISKQQSYRDKYTEAAIAAGKTREEAIEIAKKQAERANAELVTNLHASTDRLSTNTKEVNDYSDAMNNLNDQLTNSSLTSIDESYLRSRLNYYSTMREKALKKQDEYIKDLQDLSDPEICKSSFGELFYNLLDNYRGFMDIFSSEQMVIILNLLGYTSLTGVITNIAIVILGDRLIDALKLETKYPKIATYIRYKQTINKLYVSFYIGYFYFLIVLLISLNLFMFLYDYFV